MAFVSGALGAALSYGSAAYNYNMSRFQFDAGQRQASVHQSQNLRISLWNLFREDVRDLFGITTSNLGTYTVMGTLFLGFIVNMVWNAVKDFPEDPPWMILMYLNCLMPAVAFGVVSVWLAMHGTIAAHVASVKVLTQAVRPPIPTSSDVANISKNLSQYEGANAETLLQVPNFFNWRGLQDFTQVASGRRQAPSPTDQEATHVNGARILQDDHSSVAPREIDRRAASLLTDPDGGPGSSALLGAHVDLFKQLQPTYLCFEAYSRVSLTIAAHYLLLTFAYFTLAHIYVWRSEKTGVSKHPQLVGWLSVLFLCFTSYLLFNLDMFVSKRTRIRITITLFAGPLTACLAVSLWSWRADLHKGGGQIDSSLDCIPQYVAVLACLFHMLWEFSVLWEARPCGKAMLPISFRSIQYTDIFGWWYNTHKQPLARSTPSTDSTALASDEAKDEDEALRHLGELSRILDILSAEKISVALPDDYRQRISTIREGLTSLRLPTTSRPLPILTSTRFGWLRCPFVSDEGQETSYFVNISTGDVSWDISKMEGDAPILDLALLSERVESLREKVMLLHRVFPVADIAPRPSSFATNSTDTQSIGAFDDGFEETDPNHSHVELLASPMRIQSDSRAGRVFTPMRRTPNSRHIHSSLAWRSFCQISAGVILLWSLTVIWIALYGSDLGPNIELQESANSESVTDATSNLRVVASQSHDTRIAENEFQPSFMMLQRTWPREFFSPSTLACSGNTVALGERFALFTSNLSSWLVGEKNQFARTFSYASVPLSWSSVAISHESSALLLSATNGNSVLEYPIAGSCEEDDCRVPEEWKLRDSTDFTIRSIATISKELAASECSTLEGDIPKWAVMAITSQNEILCLCPWKQHLVPVRSVRGRLQDEIDGLEALHYHGFVLDSQYIIWLLVHTTKRAELRKISLRGELKGSWSLPLERNWANGLCSLEAQGILASASSRTNMAELWHFHFGNRSID